MWLVSLFLTSVHVDVPGFVIERVTYPPLLARSCELFAIAITTGTGYLHTCGGAGDSDDASALVIRSLQLQLPPIHATDGIARGPACGMTLRRQRTSHYCPLFYTTHYCR